MKPNNPPEFTALIGLDWGDKSHAIALEPAGGSTETSTLEHSAETLHQWLDQLEQRFGARQVAIAIETDQGAVVYALLERPWITLYPIHPATSTRHRTMFRPSGAADDLPDALVLLSLLQHHRPRSNLMTRLPARWRAWSRPGAKPSTAAPFYSISSSALSKITFLKL